MFGFPDARALSFPPAPVAGYDWPPEEGIVDRDLDLAISQFAPGAETVKDGLIHTSVGVVNYRPQGNAVVEQPNPLGPPPPDRFLPQLSGGGCAARSRRESVPFAAQRRCSSQDTKSSSCLSRLVSGRGSAGNVILTASLSGRPVHRGPKMGATLQPLTPRANFGVWSGPETIFVVNDNGGRCFDFAKLSQGETWVTREALTQIDSDNPTD